MGGSRVRLVALIIATAGCGRSWLDEGSPGSGPEEPDTGGQLDAGEPLDVGEELDVIGEPDTTRRSDASGAPDVTEQPDVRPPCAGRCVLTFASGPDWASFAGESAPDAGDAHGASLGPARVVCAGPQSPVHCPTTASGVLVYGDIQGAWGAGSSMPQAFWIWRGDVTPSAPADLQIGVFEQTFVLGAQPAGTLQIGADDSAAVFVNDVAVGTVGSVTNISIAGRDQNTATTFDLTSALRAGSNKITVVGQNGPSQYAGCSSPCTYAQNPAGVVFAGTLSWQ